MSNTSETPELSVILPCQNEEETIGNSIKTIKKVLEEYSIFGEIIVSDSSTDNSPNIAKNLGVTLIKHDKNGYGRAYLEGFKHAKGGYIFCADPDGTYDFTEIPRFLSELKKGNDLVIGNRFGGEMSPQAMPILHKYIGTPILSFLFRLFFKSRLYDINSGMRMFKTSILQTLNLQTTGMEFASEMIIKAIRNNLKILEINIDYHSRVGTSKLKSFRDGWRHLRFMLLYSPIYLFLVPGAILLWLGISSFIWLYLGNATVAGIPLFFHPLFVSSLLIMTGYQLIIFAIFAKTYAITHLDEDGGVFNSLYKIITLERGALIGLGIIILGALIFLGILYGWVESGFGALREEGNSILALTLIVFGMQTISSSFMFSILGIEEK